jgi:hypothetical protein
MASIPDLLYPNDIYPTAELQDTFIANDVVNLFIGLPIRHGRISIRLFQLGKRS